MRTIIPLLLAATLAGCAHDPRATIAVVGPNKMQDEFNLAAQRCGVSGSLDYQLHCGVKEMFAHNPRVPLDEARFVIDVELLHPLQAEFAGPLDARLTIRERATGRTLAQVDAHADLARSRPELAVAELLHGMAQGLSAGASSR